MSFPNHGTLADRRKRGRIYGMRSAASRRAAMATRTPDAYTQLRRSQDDRRGERIRHGIICRQSVVIPWSIRRALTGNVRSYELVFGATGEHQSVLERGNMAACENRLERLTDVDMT